MMVADDKVDAFPLGVCHLVGGLNATIKHDDKSDTRLAGIIDSLSRNAIAILVAVRDVIVNVAVEL